MLSFVLMLADTLAKEVVIIRSSRKIVHKIVR